MDSTSIPDAPVDVTSALTDGVEGLRVGVVKELFLEGTEPGVLARVREGLDRLERLGARLEECSLPSFEYALSAYYLIAPAECSSNLARYDGVRWGLRAKDSADVVDMMQRTRQAGFGAEVKRRIMLGTYALSAGYYDAYYGQAQKVRTLVRRELDDAYRALRPAGRADGADGGLPDRREDRRPAGHVPQRRVHHPGQPGRQRRRVGAGGAVGGGCPSGSS